MNKMELKEGMYVKFYENKYIAKLININDFREPNFKYGLEANYHNDIIFVGEKDIQKASFDIIDLIEDGDLITLTYFSLRYDERVTRLFQANVMDDDICFENCHCSFYLPKRNWSEDDIVLEPIIKSIVTKEMFKQMEYEVE